MIREKRLAQAAITTADVPIYTVPEQMVAMLKDFDIVNTTGGALTVKVHIVPVDLTVGTSNALLYGNSIAANAPYPWRGTQVMEAGDRLYVKGSAIGLTITASGVERRL